ncbi:MAG: GntR family transcriptional regulator [Solirubrobacterales bacterium]
MPPRDLLAEMMLSGSADEAAADSIAERVYQDLRDELLFGHIPLGERLIEEHLAERYACSRTPVREALHRLQADGHVVRHPMGGITPQPPQATAIEELYELRVVLEDLIVRRAANAEEKLKVADLRASWAELAQIDPDRRSKIATPDFVYADEAFHEGLAAAAGNHSAARYLRDINERIRILRVHDFTTDDRIDATIAEHIEIADAVLAGEVDAAAALMRVHIDRSARVVEDRVGRMLARMFDASAGSAE